MQRIAMLMVALAACATEPTGPDGVSRSERYEYPLWGGPTIDLLFVIDDSPAMASAQASLAANAHRFGEILAQLGGTADLQVGVTTGDGTGTLIGAGCLAPGAQWLRDATRSNGVHVRNYDGGLADALACMMGPGAAGPSTRQPLESMRRALGTLGFVRADAALYVVIVSSGDDCSLRDGATPPGDPFACIEATIACDQSDLRAPGGKTGCHVLTGSPLVRDVGEYTRFLAELKPSGDLIVAAAIGPPAPITITDGPALAPSCSAASATAQPALRLLATALTNGLPSHAVTASLCDDDLSGVMDGIDYFDKQTLGLPCFADGTTSDCAVELVRDAYSTRETSTIVPACDASSYATPCWSFRTLLGCESIGIDFGDAPVPFHAWVRAECAIE